MTRKSWITALAASLLIAAGSPLLAYHGFGDKY